MKTKYLLPVIFVAFIYACGTSTEHFPAENDEKRDYTENKREEYNPPRDKGDIENKAEEKIELNNEIKE